MDNNTHKRGFFGYEGKHHPVVSRTRFAKRLLRSLAISSSIIFVSLLGGMCGYHFLEGMPWLDAFHNASMILGGMGPVDPLKTDGGKFFAGCYALYSGLIVIAAAGIIVVPVMHRLLHSFHAEADVEKKH